MKLGEIQDFCVFSQMLERSFSSNALRETLVTKLKLFYSIFIAIIGTATACPQGNAHAVQIWTAGYGPTNDVRVLNPRFVWQVWADGDSKITGATMVINGKKVEASYDAKKKELYFESPEPLKAGTYEVMAKIKVDNWANFDKKWTVTIRPDALPVAEMSPETRRALAEFNRIRSEHGLPAFRFDSSLNSAASSHTKYLAINREGGHAEEPGKPGFTGAQPADRVGLFGHVGSSWEVVSMGGKTPEEGVQGLWDAPYHRIRMMQPGPGILGASFQDIFFTIDGDGADVDGVFVSPGDGCRDISPTWHNQEIPDPTRFFPEAPTTIGYPVVMNVYGAEINHLTILESKFETITGEDVPRYELSAENDEHLQTSIILLPKKPLGANTTYMVSLKVRDNKGNVHNKTWKFRTK